ncbi:MAG: hypothetical protein ACYCTV_05085 [Leptospirales bacterium]
MFPALLLLTFLGPLQGAQIALSSAWAAEPPGSSRRDADWNTIQSTVDRHQYPLAERQIAQYIRTHPGNRDAYILGGRIARKIHKPDTGLSILDKGLGRFHSDPTLLRLKAELLLEKGDMLRSKKILSQLSRKKDESPSEKKKVREDQKVLNELALSMPPLITFDQNINFQEVIPPPFQSPEAYILENSSYHLKVTNINIAYPGGASIGTGVSIETPLIKDTVHFQAGTNLYVGAVSGQNSAVESYLYGGVDGQGPDGIQFLADAGDVFAGGQVNAGFYGHVDIPVGPLRVDAQGWYQLPWSGYGEAIVAGGLQSGGLVNATWTILPKLSLSGEYEYTYDTLQGNQTPFGVNHNTVATLDWGFLKSPDLHLVAGYDTQTFTPFVPNPTAQVPILLFSNFGFFGLSSLDQIGRYVVLNGQMGGVVGTFGTPGPVAGFQGDGGISFQLNPHIELYANLSYETLAAAYIGAVTTTMFGLNIWF